MQADRFRRFLPLAVMAMVALLVVRPKSPHRRAIIAPDCSNVITLPYGHKKLWLGVAATTLLTAGVVVMLQTAQSHKRNTIARELTGGNPDNAAELATRYGCSGCHTIPGLPGADGQVAPSLAGLRHRVFIGGVLRNNAENLANWIVAPQQFSPKSAMPPTGISEREARDIAAYLYAN